MRADRLLSLLLLLQARGQMTARQLASELAVSERTIYRDIDALSLAGVPVYGEAGPEGGYALIDSYRTNLTGLTEHEVRALFMLSIPAPLADLGVGQELQAALRKLSAALPDAMRQDERKARQRIHLDSNWWHQGGERVPFLQTIQAAIWQDRKLNVVDRPHVAVEIERVVDPYGLVAKAGVWYLVCAGAGRIRVFRIADLVALQPTEETFDRPVDFDLVEFWTDWCESQERHQTDFGAVVRVAPTSLPDIERSLGKDVRVSATKLDELDADGWLRLELSFSSFEEARERILSFGRGVEVIAPQSLRRSVLDYAEQIVDLYKTVSAR